MIFNSEIAITQFKEFPKYMVPPTITGLRMPDRPLDWCLELM